MVKRKKQKASKVTKREDPLFVGVSSPGVLRKDLLESSKDILKCLKDLEGLKALRAQKIESVSLLNTLMKEIKALLSKLKKKLPSNHNIKPIKHQEIVVSSKEKEVSVEVPVEQAVQKPKTELEKLEEELAMIESKINSQF